MALDLDKMFNKGWVDKEQAEQIKALGLQYYIFAKGIQANTPASAEQTLALRHLHDSFEDACDAICWNRPQVVAQPVK